jgi:hypothetical protein
MSEERQQPVYDGNITLFLRPRIALENLVHPSQRSCFALDRRQHKVAANEQLKKFCAVASKFAKVRDTDHYKNANGIVQAFNQREKPHRETPIPVPQTLSTANCTPNWPAHINSPAFLRARLIAVTATICAP